MKYIKRFNESVSQRKMTDYTIFKIRYYADSVNIAKGKFDDEKNEGWERGKLLNSLFTGMVEFITNKPVSYWMDKYGFGYIDCMKEDLHETYGIIIPNSEEYEYWLIPNEMTDVIEWVKENCKLPYSIVKRYADNDWLSRKKPMNIHRKMARPIK